MDRFQAITNGEQWFVVDRLTQEWYHVGNEKAPAFEKARGWSYEWDQIVGGQMDFREDPS